MAQYKINKHKQNNPSPMQMNSNKGAVAGGNSRVLYTIKKKEKKN